MPRLTKIVIPICMLWLLAIAAFDWWQSNLIKLLTMPVSLAYFGAFIASLICLFACWRRWQLRAAIPLAVCIITIELLRAFSSPLEKAGFMHIAPRYASVIRRMETSEIPVTTNPVKLALSPAEAELAYVAWYTKSSNGVFCATFFVGAGFPLKHWGYLYSSAGKIAPGSDEDREWPVKKPLQKNWFYIAD